MELIVIPLVIVLLLLFIRNLTSTKPTPVDFQFELQSNLLSDAENKFYQFLVSKINETEYKVMAKVRLADIFRCTNEGKLRHSGFNRIKAKHFDFVIINNLSSKIICAIELDDKSHNRKSAVKNDMFKNKVCADTNLKLIRVKVAKYYNDNTLRELGL